MEEGKALEVVRDAIQSCGIASCLWKREERPSRIRIVVRSDADWFEVEVRIKLSFTETRIKTALVEAIEAARKDVRVHGARFDGDRAGDRDTSTLDMFEASAS